MTTTYTKNEEGELKETISEEKSKTYTLKELLQQKNDLEENYISNMAIINNLIMEAEKLGVEL